MNIQITNHLSRLAQQFNLGKLLKSEKLESGLINDSYKIETDRGIFVIQRLSSLWNEKVIDDYCQVQRYLRTNGVFVPVLLQNTVGKAFVADEQGLWRTFEYVPHDVIITPIPDIAEEAGAMLGRFHSVMSSSSFRPTFVLPGYHNTFLIIKNLKECLANREYEEKVKNIWKESECIFEGLKDPSLPFRTKKNVIHGDPKLLNFLFKNNHVTALLDLDTMMDASPLLDLGDALRSWCRRKPSTSEFLPEIFDAALKGYNRESHFPCNSFLAKECMKIITLELAARYLIDYFRESYFPLKSEKYKTKSEQNLARCRRYLEYYQNFIGGT